LAQPAQLPGAQQLAIGGGGGRSMIDDDFIFYIIFIT
jgi:hypothetical protein